MSDLAIAGHMEDVGPEWDRLVESAAISPFYGRQWTEAWYAAFGTGELRVATLRREGELAAVLPLQLRRGRYLSTANWHTPVYGPAAVDARAARELLERLFWQEDRCFELWFLDSGEGVLDVASAAAEAVGRPLLSRPLMASPYLALDGTHDDFLAGLSKNRRKSLRRGLNGMRRDGEVRMDVISDEQALGPALEEAFALEASGWKGDRGTAIVSRQDTRQFYEDIARRAARHGWLRLATLRVGDTPAAFDLALECQGAWYSLKAGYNESLARVGPGAVLLNMLIERGYDQGLHRFDLLGQSDDFKLGWTNRTSERSWVRAFARNPGGRARAVMFGTRERARPLARAVRRRVATAT